MRLPDARPVLRAAARHASLHLRRRRGSRALPYLRFNRDKRGYENTYIVHAERRRGRSRSRILYWFRTPPGVKVGRAALDPDAMRRIEQQNPDLEFDWPRIIKGQGSPSTEPRPPATNGDVRRPGPHEARRFTPPPPSAQAAPEEPRIDSAPREEETAPQESAPHQSAPQESAPKEAELVVRERRNEPLPVVPADVVIPAHDKLGVDGVQRLRHRYAEIMTRVGERVADPARRDELKATVERLNPDAWTTPDDVTLALEQYESVLASVREVVGRKRRRRRRGSRGGEARSAELNGQPDSAAGVETGEGQGDLEPDDSGADDL